jgi:hypothetical protein
MNQALYAHMNNKRKKKESIALKSLDYLKVILFLISFSLNILGQQSGRLIVVSLK